MNDTLDQECHAKNKELGCATENFSGHALDRAHFTFAVILCLAMLRICNVKLDEAKNSFNPIS